MRHVAAAMTVLVLIIVTTGTAGAGSPSTAPMAATNVVLEAGLRPLATKKPTPKASPSASPSPGPTPTARRPVDDEGDRWINLAVIGGVSLIGTVLILFVAGWLVRRSARRRQG